MGDGNFVMFPLVPFWLEFLYVQALSVVIVINFCLFICVAIFSD